MLHERSQICTGKGADDAPTDGRTEFVAGHVMYKAEAAASLPPSSLRLLGWSRHCKNSPSRLRLSLSLSLKWVALPREAIDYFEEEAEA